MANSKRRIAEALAQISLLRGDMSNDGDLAQSDFYTYRYFASEGFLPGYSFPRLPLRALHERTVHYGCGSRKTVSSMSPGTGGTGGSAWGSTGKQESARSCRQKGGNDRKAWTVAQLEFTHR